MDENTGFITHGLMRVKGCNLPSSLSWKLGCNVTKFKINKNTKANFASK